MQLKPAGHGASDEVAANALPASIEADSAQRMIAHIVIFGIDVSPAEMNFNLLSP